ncbi:hypothetical protein O181_027968 [Austropuccinia psidii MF-1]|uniref:Small ribosomal subunit protein mS23 n=1 Tax=Austropuccinia psidii MF-1 TaxID=1389203 RepID=A0A9Q3CQL1_9BASI|nr:hypothetical protein [Austropuccinia psidii MF-1]
MPRHHPILVHKQLSSQLQAGYLKRPPPAYSALIDHPPAPTPLQFVRSSAEPSIDHPSDRPLRSPKILKFSKKLKPKPIQYDLRDRLRRAFFRDHPFEAYRPRTLIESVDGLVAKTQDKNEIRRLDPQTLTVQHHSASRESAGLNDWERLDQLSILPSAEDCINFAENLHLNKSYSLNQAYKIAVSQFRTLKFENEIQRSFARQEAEYYAEPNLDLSQGSDERQHEMTYWKRDLVKRQIECQDSWILNQDGMKQKTLNIHQKRNQDIDQSNQSLNLQNRIFKNFDLDLSSQNLNKSSSTNEMNGFKEGQNVLEEIMRKSKRLNKKSIDTTPIPT